jgi:dienelactone hydrolase
MVANRRDGVEVREVRYEADGRQLVGTLATPDGPGPHPAVLIAHEGPGLDEIQRGRAAEIAALGYVGFALDYHGELSPFPTRDAMMVRLGELFADPDRARSLASAALDVVLADPAVDPTRIAAIGYCFGGTMALELGRTGADLRAIVGFHPGLTNVRPADSANIRGRVLVCIGADDPIIPPEHRSAFEDEMRAAHVDWQMHLYGGVVHSFTHPRASDAGLPGIAYDQRAAEHSWAAMKASLDEVFRGHGTP